MNKQTSAFCISLLLLFNLTFQNLNNVKSATEEEETEFYFKSLVTYSNKGNKTWNLAEREEDCTIGLFMNNSWQTVYLVNSTLPIGTTKNDKDGNHIAVLQFPEMLLEPGQNISYAVTYHIVSKSRTVNEINEVISKTLNEIPEFLREKYSGAGGPWLVNDTELQNMANLLAGTETRILTIVKKLIDWIERNIDFTQANEVPLYPNETFIERKGDCDDQAILLVTLCRILGIPAFTQIGAIYTSHQSKITTNYWENHLTVIQKHVGWHGWAMVYVPPWGWLPVDLTYVLGGQKSAPLNAIKNAVVTSQNTILYMNISQIDYVASSRNTRDYLKTNKFYVHMEDEMTKVIGQKNEFGESVEPLFPKFLVVAVLLLFASSYVIARRLKREKEITAPLSKRSK